MMENDYFNFTEHLVLLVSLPACQSFSLEKLDAILIFFCSVSIDGIPLPEWNMQYFPA